MEFTPDQVSAFRYWIQGYANFYEPIVEEYFRVSGYRVLRRPALVQKPDIQRIVNGLFDGHKQLGPELDNQAIRRHLTTPQLAGFIERQLRYLDAAVAELRQALRPGG